MNDLKFGDVCEIDWKYKGFLGEKVFKGLAVYVAPGSFFDPKTGQNFSVVESKCHSSVVRRLGNVYLLGGESALQNPIVNKRVSKKTKKASNVQPGKG